MNTSLQSDEKSYKSNDQRTQAIIDMNASKTHILTYYFRNLRKYNNIKMMKYFLELQLKIIASIIIMILLFKSSLIVIILYFSYIIYFYTKSRNEANEVSTLNLTAYFLAFVTMLQYTSLLLAQKITSSSSSEPLPLWKFVIEKATGVLISGSLEEFGIANNDPNSLLLEILPMIVYQGTIFYFDFFLFRVA